LTNHLNGVSSTKHNQMMKIVDILLYLHQLTNGM